MPPQPEHLVAMRHMPQQRQLADLLSTQIPVYLWFIAKT
jgi:hypothetical protein